MLRIAPLAGALVVGSGIALAAPANADAATDEYIQWLDYYDVNYRSPQDAIDAGLAACSKMRDGQFDSARDDLGDSDAFGIGLMGLADGAGTTNFVIDSAVFALCPDTAEPYLDNRYVGSFLEPDWTRDDPDRFQRALDSDCSQQTRPGCSDIPEMVVNRLGDQVNPATRSMLWGMCGWVATSWIGDFGPGQPPCVW